MSGGVHPAHPGEPLLYVYQADSGQGYGVYGVTDVFGVAKRRLIEALTAMPYGARGSIRRARLDILAVPYPSYRYGSAVACAWRDTRSGVIVAVGTLLESELAADDSGESPLSLWILDAAPPEGRR